MIVLNNVELDFDITSPECMKRYTAALKKLEKSKSEQSSNMLQQNAVEKTQNSDISIQNSNALEQYTQFIQTECTLVTNFIDEVFGNGTCNLLLGNKVSLVQLFNLCEDLLQQINQQTKKAQALFELYKPNTKTENTKRRK